MTIQNGSRDRDGMARKIRLLATNCAAATNDFPRTLLIAVSAPDPVGTPDCEMAAPRAIRVQTLDDGMTSADIALLMGTIYGLLDRIEDDYTREFGEKFRDLVDDARASHGHAIGVTFVPVTPSKSTLWKAPIPAPRDVASTLRIAD